MGSHHRHTDIDPGAMLGRQLAVLDIEFDQSLGMLRDEGEGHQQDRPLGLGRGHDQLVGGGADPGQRSDPALEPQLPILALEPELRHQSPAGRIDPLDIGIA